MDLGATSLPPVAAGLPRLSAEVRLRRFRLAARPRPIRSARPSKAKPKRAGAVFFAHRADGAFLARRRPPKGLLASTVELPGTAWTSEGPGEDWTESAPCGARFRRLPGTVVQAFTHFALTLTVHAAPYEGDPPGDCFWVAREAVGGAGFSNVMRKAVTHALEAGQVESNVIVS